MNPFEKFLPEIVITLSWMKSFYYFVIYAPELANLSLEIEKFKLPGH